MKRFLIFNIFFSFLFCTICFAHGDLDERIAKATKELKKTPDSAYLYFKRGKLFYQHEEFQKSIEDLKEAEKLKFYSQEQTLLFAKNYFELEDYYSTISFLDKILHTDSQNVLCIKLKAQTYLKLNKFYEAALHFEKVIEYSSQSFPENYIDTSVAWESLNTNEGYQNAIQIIDEGIFKLGELTILLDRQIQIAVTQKNYDVAIKTQQRIIELSNRKESAYFKLSELYNLKRDSSLALESLNLAKEHFNKLPLRIQNTSSMKDLLKNINASENLLHSN